MNYYNKSKMCDWLQTLKNAKKSCIVDGNLKKVHYDLGNGEEMVEEYNTDTNVLTRRAWKRHTKLGGDGEWDIEVGDPEPQPIKSDQPLIKESSCQPIVSRRQTRKSLEWRIRNLTYPLPVYSVTADNNDRCLIIRTSNKKYYKKLAVPELDRLNLPIEQSNVSIQHRFNTLIITYQKPKELIQFENCVLEEVKKLKPKDCGDMNCRPS